MNARRARKRVCERERGRDSVIRSMLRRSPMGAPTSTYVHCQAECRYHCVPGRVAHTLCRVLPLSTHSSPFPSTTSLFSFISVSVSPRKDRGLREGRTSCKSLRTGLSFMLGTIVYSRRIFHRTIWNNEKFENDRFPPKDSIIIPTPRFQTSFLVVSVYDRSEKIIQESFLGFERNVECIPGRIHSDRKF